MNIGVCIPCYNNRDTVASVIQAVRIQTQSPGEVIVIDDGSEDGSAEVAASLGVKVLRSACNLGRGATRARAFEELNADLIFSFDATVIPEPDFIERATLYFRDHSVAAVCGWFVERSPQTFVARWRARHLYKNDEGAALQTHALLVTGACVIRRDACLGVGNFDKSLRHSEDAELGRRLLKAGYSVILDPSLTITGLKPPSLSGTLERYWRWYAGESEALHFVGYLRNVAYSLKVMARRDLACRDPGAALISLACPHYQFFRTLLRKCTMYL